LRKQTEVPLRTRAEDMCVIDCRVHGYLGPSVIPGYDMHGERATYVIFADNQYRALPNQKREKEKCRGNIRSCFVTEDSRARSRGEF